MSKKRKSKPKTLPPIHANRGIEADYKRKLDRLIIDMNKDIIGVLKKEQNKIAQDGALEEHIKGIIALAAQRWYNRFDVMAKKIAKQWAKKAFYSSQYAFQKAMRDAGWTVKPKKLQAIENALDVAIIENVNLIRSIPSQHFGKIEKAVRKSFDKGRDLFKLRRDIQSIYPVTKRRAALIARDQTMKANSEAVKASQIHYGFTHAIWQHSHAGKNPRKDHLAADGKQFEIAKGMELDDGWIQPGQLINCRCTSRPVIPMLGEGK